MCFYLEIIFNFLLTSLMENSDNERITQVKASIAKIHSIRNALEHGIKLESYKVPIEDLDRVKDYVFSIQFPNDKAEDVLFGTGVEGIMMKAAFKSTLRSPSKFGKWTYRTRRTKKKE